MIFKGVEFGRKCYDISLPILTSIKLSLAIILIPTNATNQTYTLGQVTCKVSALQDVLQ